MKITSLMMNIFLLLLNRCICALSMNATTALESSTPTATYNGYFLSEPLIIATPSLDPVAPESSVDTAGYPSSTDLDHSQLGTSTNGGKATEILLEISSDASNILTSITSSSAPTDSARNAHSPTSIERNAPATVSSLEIFADILMGFVIGVSFFGLIPPVLKIKKNGVTKHLIVSIVFQILLITEQCLGIWARYTSAPLPVKASISSLALILSLWSRFYCIRMTELLISSFQKVAVYAYLGNLLFFMAVASPLFLWWWTIDERFTMVWNIIE